MGSLTMVVSLTTSLVGCFIVSATIGFIYDFSIYSGALKLHFHLDQSQLDWVATSGCLMFFVSPICGHLVDKHGPRPGVLFGGACMTLGLTLSYLFAHDLILPQYGADPAAATVVLCVFACLTTIGANAASAVAYSLPPKLFPRQRGRVTGIVKAFAGLSGGLLAQLYTLSVSAPSSRPETLTFLVFLGGACFFLDLCIAAWLFPSSKRNRNSADNTEETDLVGRLRRGYWVVVVLILSIFGCSLMTAVPTESTNQSNATNGTAIIAPQSPTAIVAVGVFLVIVAAVPVAVSVSWSTTPESNKADAPEYNVLRGSTVVKNETNQTIDLAENNDVGTFAMLCHLDFWLVAVSGMAAVGGGYMLTTNSFQLIQSSTLPDASADTAISMFSACQGLARMVGGAGPELVGNAGGATTRRPLFLSMFCAVMVLGHILLRLGPVLGSLELLYAGYCLAGIGFGGVWPCLVTISADLFGLAHLGSNYMVYDGSTALIGSLLMGKVLPQYVYENNCEKGSTQCHGGVCFALAHMVIVVVNVVGALSALWLWVRVMKRKRKEYRVVQE